jgi:hypothetical protein
MVPPVKERGGRWVVAVEVTERPVCERLVAVVIERVPVPEVEERSNAEVDRLDGGAVDGVGSSLNSILGSRNRGVSMARGAGGERETEGNGLMSRRVFGVMNEVEGTWGVGGFSGVARADTSVFGRL